MTSVVFLLTILGVVVFLTVTKRDVIETEPEPTRRLERPGRARVLVVANKTAATPALVEAVRAARGRRPGGVRDARAQPRPPRVRPRRRGHRTRVSGCSRRRCRPRAGGRQPRSRAASPTSPNAFDDIVAELEQRSYSEIILETLPRHVSHWLHVDLAAATRPSRLPADDGHGDPLGGVGATCSGACQEARLMITGMSLHVPPGR